MIVIVTNWVPPYRTPVLEYVSLKVKEGLRIISTKSPSFSDPKATEVLDIRYSPSWYFPFTTNYRKVEASYSEGIPFPILLPWQLLACKPKLVVSGNMGAVSLVCLAVARVLGIPFVIWTEATPHSSSSINWVQRSIRKVLMKYTDAYLAWGRPACAYLEQNGIDARKIYYCPQSIDNGWWISMSEKACNIQSRHQIPNASRVFICVGRLVKGKGVDVLLRAWAKLDRKKQCDSALLIVGDGECRSDLEALASELSIPNIEFVGGVGQEELPYYLSKADVFVFPSLVDVWGMVVNEAYACGVPVIASKYTGVAQELVAGCEFGDVVDVLDIREFSAALDKWIDSEIPDKEAVRMCVSAFNYDRSAESMLTLFRELLFIRK